jgi:hypothetical protein
MVTDLWEVFRVGWRALSHLCRGPVLLVDRRADADLPDHPSDDLRGWGRELATRRTVKEPRESSEDAALIGFSAYAVIFP